MTVAFRAVHDEPVSSPLERWPRVVDETFGPAHVPPPRGASAPQQLVVGDVGAAMPGPRAPRRSTSARPRGSQS